MLKYTYGGVYIMLLKKLFIVPVAFLIISLTLTSCGYTKNRERKENLVVMCSWLEVDFWKNSLCEFAYYNLKGTKTDGSVFDYEEMLKNHNALFLKISEYNTYVTSLEDEKYDNIKTMWTKVYDESVNLNEKIINREIAECANADFEVDSLYKYINELSVKVDKL